MEAVTAMDEGAKEVENGTDRAVEAGDALKNILTAAEAVNQQASTIATAAQQMSAYSNDMRRAMETFSAVVN